MLSLRDMLSLVAWRVGLGWLGEILWLKGMKLQTPQASDITRPEPQVLLRGSFKCVPMVLFFELMHGVILLG